MFKYDEEATPTAGTPNSTDNGGTQGGAGEDKTPKTFTQEDVDRIAAKRALEERERMSKTQEEAIRKALEEQKELDKLSQADREKQLLAKTEQKIAEQERNLILRENKLDGIEILNEKKIPIKFIDFVLHNDKNTMLKNIDSLHKEWTEAIAQEVKNQLKSDTPKDVSTNNTKANVDAPVVF